jgi:hypothetical protein
MRLKQTEHKRFEDWSNPTVKDCNHCARYFDSSCDGVTVGEERECKAFTVTRYADLYEEIDNLKNIIYSITLVSVGIALLLVILIAVGWCMIKL